MSNHSLTPVADRARKQFWNIRGNNTAIGITEKCLSTKCQPALIKGEKFVIWAISTLTRQWSWKLQRKSLRKIQTLTTSKPDSKIKCSTEVGSHFWFQKQTKIKTLSRSTWHQTRIYFSKALELRGEPYPRSQLCLEDKPHNVRLKLYQKCCRIQYPQLVIQTR